MSQENMSPGKVLFVDDDRGIRALLTELAVGDGIEDFEVFGDADSAVSRLKELEATAAAIFSDGLHGGWKQVIAAAKEANVPAFVLSDDLLQSAVQEEGAVFIPKTGLAHGLMASILAGLEVSDASSNEKSEVTSGTLVDMLNKHADEVVERSPTNINYAETVRRRAQEAERLITTHSGEVRGVAVSWMDNIQPIAEFVFGRKLEGEQIGVFREHTPTVFDGVYGRTRILSADEMFGPTIALDLAAEDSLPKEASNPPK